MLGKFAHTYRRLTLEEGNSINFLEQVVKINKGLDQSLREIVGVFDDYEDNNGALVEGNIIQESVYIV